MRTKSQENERKALRDILKDVKDLKGKLISHHNDFKNKFILSELDNLFLEKDSTIDENLIPTLVTDYIEFFNIFKTYIVFFIEEEEYELCAMVENTINLCRQQTINIISKRITKLNEEEIFNIISTSENNLIKNLENLYGI